jgi:hypothetical protein
VHLKRIGLLTFLLWLVIPSAGFGQSWVDVSPGEIHRPPASPSCYTITVGDGAYMSVDLEFYFQGGGPYYTYGWPTLDGNGQAVACVDQYTGEGLYEFTGIRNSAYPWTSFVPVHANLAISPPTPAIYGLGPGGENWDAIWISGAQFQPDSRVYVYSADWSSYQIFWGPAWGYSPGMWVSGDGSLITLQVTDPTVRTSFGNAGLFVLVVNDAWTPSDWAWTHSPPPLISSGGTGCDDGYCIWLMGSFPLDASVDLRIPGQSDVVPNAYSDFNVTPTYLALRLNPAVRHEFDWSGFNAWVVNASMSNGSGGYYIPPVDRAITGNIDGIVLSGMQYYVTGWACAKTYAGSIDVHVYLGGPAGTGTFAFGGTANQANEPGVTSACNSTGTHYRFSLPIPPAITQEYGGKFIYVHGISPYGLGPLLIGNSGTFPVPRVDLSVTGSVTGVVLENQQYYLRGWACSKTNPASIGVHLYAGGPEGSGTSVTTATANMSSNPTTTAECGTNATNYGFSILLSLAIRQQFGGQVIYVTGISPFGFPDLLLGNPGNLTIPLAMATSSKEYIYIGDRLLAVDITNLP